MLGADALKMQLVFLNFIFLSLRELVELNYSEYVYLP